MVPMKRIYQLVFKMLFLLDGGAGLRNLSLWSPRGALSGAAAGVTLRCSYELEGAALYSARWYRGEHEFYRYVPREMPPTMVFPLPGANVDLSASDAQSVRIVGLSRRLSGVFACEVSADAPLFHTDIRAAPLTIVDPPREPLQLTSRGTYVRGAPLLATCLVPPAYPQPNISWTLDGIQIAEHISPAPADGDFSERATRSDLQLTFVDEPHSPDHSPYHSTDHSYQHSLDVNTLYHQPGHDFYEHTTEQPVSAAARAVRPAPAGGRAALRCAAQQYDAWSARAAPLLLREDAPRPASVTRHDDGASNASGASRGVSALCACVCACVAILQLLL